MHESVNEYVTRRQSKLSVGAYRKEGRMCKLGSQPAVPETASKLFLAWELSQAALSSTTSPCHSTQNL